jgi:uncharacterized RDD family membrane protein YckC
MVEQITTQPMLACSQCRRSFTQSDLVQIAGNWVCAECKPAFLSRVMTGTASTNSRWEYGGVGIRFGARIIDSIALLMLFGVLLLCAALIPGLTRNRGAGPNAIFLNGAVLFGFLFVFLAAIAYEVVMLRYWGGTLGKMATGLIVVRSDGRGLGWGVSFGRFFMWNVVTNGIPYVNIVLTLISTVMAGRDNESRALHDRVCDTRVIYKRSVA